MTKRSGGALLQALTIDRSSRIPIGTQLCCALRELILSSAIEPGQRLPSSRTLANDLDISRTTAIGVYEQLATERLITSRVGAGAYVSEELTASRPIPADPEPSAAAARQSTRLARLMAGASEQFFQRLSHPVEPRAFTTGMPAFDEFPMAVWARLSAKYWREPRNIVLGYPEAGGSMVLRGAIAAHLRTNRGVICRAEEIFIVNGAQEAFHRIGNTLIDPGDKVWFENPGAIGARNALISCGARLVPLSIDSDGIDVAEGLRMAPNFRLAFVTPSHQHPLGVNMSLTRRFELLRAAERAGAWIIEDDYDGDFYYSGRPLPTLKSIDAAGRVIYVGTFSKSLFPALRLGYVVVPPELVGIFNRIAGAILNGAPANLQAIVANFIQEGHFASHVRRMRKIYAERHDIFVEAAQRRLSGLLDVKVTNTGLQTVGVLPHGVDEVEVATRAEARGITVAPIGRFCIDPISTKGLVLGFSGIRPRQIAPGIEILGEVLESLSGKTVVNG
ncbi:PLP-dependent aminotransferase family protein [Microvirga brassicacearum]|uniref:8-amino-7-oxononanoate synthase n=1 Tax=Microvirga brassicacearum TaxID=2580413 RepID=A0A5N3PB01_9HYPH|nr:PLP-dependent aminotransferase family protein [Microvirga brassicacearum]KAB0266873.1 PLP-dependent aminotransferase family protein [Microvirga brassicacearum]